MIHKKIYYYVIAGIIFMANNMTLFENNFLVDYQYWHTNLLKWLREGNEEMKTAVIFLNSFLQILGILLETTEYKKDYANLMHVSIIQ